MNAEGGDGRGGRGRKWSNLEIARLLAHHGSTTKEEEWSNLLPSRNAKARQTMLYKLGLSKYCNDGMISAAELSRLTGVPLSTIAERLRKGQLPGIKDGPTWRVEQSLVNDLNPLWDGRKADNFVDNREDKRVCFNCTRPLPETAQVWCSQRCRGAELKKLFAQRVSPLWKGKINP
ncbi:hypothetical protein A2631_03755 [Candidatus Daviesbacteria bacterium RIFCSPHIGHO2_01_FULL_44_29]|uniref:Uncharacterized protein n=1 Tax=Candidatus Daviesbacteria bacterium RIFCSPHIGHO2_02_FULL_43_12 TaxID=1797776 RepID=A0A1F5KHQ6_9BACT|nr:MAG: hypothetical protein A2631_03755 [Candidatus Daviesbacteria bacterium RIFCSPHIGHO2_01_FULL_44_29]OGE39813.1 MAG: hypothetical protein A3E86_04555 [Candidatus Daviesbacteria bacterium RIFCSPHIGHO2_12_FULL_47_45]OGE40473.1 MAG: hypothetical protein A3D25_00215 [Candidatus Daviesbacteria bacterium RIFCSPHIGHO2_02_FULL_43_12]OGE70024.1 MAG: hypothetical protein A3B55_05015 [Candidatus Daviesbacteria bacterium RIFCSPLOWO2_01_FULL_43_15]